MELDYLSVDIYHDLKRNCNHDHYESSLHEGARESVKQGAFENVGHILAFAALCSTDTGINLLDEKVKYYYYPNWSHSTNCHKTTAYIHSFNRNRQ
jgi:hypothetical protein